MITGLITQQKGKSEVWGEAEDDCPVIVSRFP